MCYSIETRMLYKAYKKVCRGNTFTYSQLNKKRKESSWLLGEQLNDDV